MTVIADLSHHETVDWSVTGKVLDFAILRVQDGSRVVDREYKKNVTGCKAYGVPFGNYAFCRFVSENDAKIEARDFWERGDKDAKIWFADIEQDTMSDMRAGTQAFIDELYRLGAQRVGVYVGHHKYRQYQVDKLQRVEAVWIPRYGGKKPDFPCDIWQYTETGRLQGVSGEVDLNYLNNGYTLEKLTGVPKVKANYFVTGGFNDPAAIAKMKEFMEQN
ncbi:glycoside hydrolase family 25 protein, partial [Bacillus cereus]